MSRIDVGVDPSVTDSRTVLLPSGLAADARPTRAVIWRHDGDSTKKRVVRMAVTRDGTTKAATGYGLFEALGGTLKPLADLTCEYRKASTLDLLRYEPSARWDALLAILSAAVAAATAWLAVDKASATDTGTRWVIAILVFVVGLLVTLLKMRKELRAVGS